MAGSGSHEAKRSSAEAGREEKAQLSYAMVEYLKDRDQHKAFLAGARGANPTNMRERLAKTQADWDNLGGDKVHVHRETSFCSIKYGVSILTIWQESQRYDTVLEAENEYL